MKYSKQSPHKGVLWYVAMIFSSLICHGQQKPASLTNAIKALKPGNLDSTQFEIKFEKKTGLVESLVIRKDRDSGKGNVGMLGTSIPVRSRAGRVRLTADLHASGISAQETGAMFCSLNNNKARIPIAFDNMENHRVLLDAKRSTYAIELLYDQPIDTIYIGFYVKGTGTLRASNIQLEADSGEFGAKWNSEVSKIISNPQAVNGLANLCKVWGFLKYHHPGIEEKKLNWDSVLVNNIDGLITEGKFRPDHLNKVYNAMIVSAGEVAKCADCPEKKYADSLAINLDLSWLKKNSLINDRNLLLLNDIYNGPSATPNRYVELGPQGTPLFKGEVTYKFIDLPKVNYRLLALFRYWNIIQYFFPYKYAIGADWNKVLEHFIPEFIQAKTIVEYKKAVAKLAASIHDSHGNDPMLIFYSLDATPERSLLPMAFKIYSDRILVISIDSEFSSRTGITQGTEIKHINAKTLKDFRSRFDPYLSASNQHYRDKILAKEVIPFLSDSIVSIGYLKDGREETISCTITRDIVQRFLKTTPPYMVPSMFGRAYKDPTEAYRILDGGIAYLNPARLTKKDADTVCLRIVRDKAIKGVIIDCRDPQPEFLVGIAQYFVEQRAPFVSINALDIKHPGVLRPGAVSYMTSNPQHFKGPVIALTESSTISKNELMVMALQANPKTKVLGNHTAGADGDVTFVSLPGKATVYYSGSRVRYPDGRETQRIGIVPDKYVVPTSDNIRSGRDTILEEAVRYIRQN